MGPRSAKIQSAILFAPMIGGSLLAILIPVFDIRGLFYVLIAVGACLIAWSKISSKKRTKEIFEFGPKSMTPREKRYYFTGYSLLLIGISLATIYVFGLRP